MGDDLLTHRMICYVEREVFATIKNDDILHHFQELKTRKKKVLNLLLLWSLVGARGISNLLALEPTNV